MEELTVKSPSYSTVTMQDCQQWDVEQNCEARRILDRLADRWSLPVMELLVDRVLRFSDLNRLLPAISARMLTATLRQLERDGLVSRQIYPVVPPKVEYRLTPLGSTLLQTVLQLAAWAEQNQKALATSRTKFDERARDAS